MDTSCSYVAFPRTPYYGGRVLCGGAELSGAQNLSGWSEFPPGHRALGLQKLGVMRFHSRAWLCRTNASDADLFLDVGAALAAARKPSPLGEGAERSEADEGCSGGYTGPPGSYHQRKPQGTPLPINGLMLVLYCKGRRFPTEDSLCKKERAVPTDSAFSSLI